MFNKIGVMMRTYPITLIAILSVLLGVVLVNMLVTDLSAKEEKAALEAAAKASISVKVKVDDQEFNMTTRQKKVGDLLETLGYRLTDQDKVYPGLEEKIENNSQIIVTRAERKSKTEVAEVKNTATREGYQFVYQEKFTDAELTAYSAGYEHTHKNPGDLYYGITFTGTEVEDGRTVAVDPKVIPLGWWIYIEGYGYRKAEDTGNAVRNKRVDIYYDDNDVALAFGLVKDVTIYVIGPDDPRSWERQDL